jgi:hypothetical protein
MALLSLSGCFRLDGFLYARPRLEQYVFDFESEPAIDPARVEELRVRVNDDIELGALYVKGPVQPPPAYVIYFSGQGSSLQNSFERIKLLASLGVDVFAVDYRGFGVSTDVTPTEAGIDEDTHAGLEYLRARVGADARIVYYGRSFGTATATQRAVSDPPAALILESPFASLEAFKSDSSGFDFPIGFIATANWNTEARIAKVRAPVLILHGTADDYVRPEFGERIYAKANDPKKLILVPGADHGNVPEKMGDQWATQVYEWIVTSR